MRIFVVTLAVFLPLLLPHAAFAHSFGKLYNLPVPFWLYLYGAAAALLVSFLIIGYFFNQKKQERTYGSIDLSRFRVFRALSHPRFLALCKTVSVLLLILTIATGFFGQNDAYANFNMNFFWIYFVLGFTYASALFGNIYALFNPWKALAYLYRGKIEGQIEYPKSFGYYPALLIYFLFIWLELVGHVTPQELSIVLAFYTLLNGFGILLFGREVWFHYCEFFSVFFRMIGKIAPFEYAGGKLYLRPPFMHLIREHAEHVSLLLFVLFMLASTAYDGFKETLPWVDFFTNHVEGVLTPFFGASSYPLFQTIGLAGALLLFFLLYLFLVWVAKLVSKTHHSLKVIMLAFAFSLIPIAFVYNIAHYYTLLLIEGPNIIGLISDPFNLGWNLFHTAGYRSSYILGANFVWNSQVAFIIIGHIIGVYLAHLVALDTFPSHKRALASQFPMLILMVTFTVIGLWILSQPITGGTL